VVLVILLLSLLGATIILIALLGSQQRNKRLCFMQVTVTFLALVETLVGWQQLTQTVTSIG
tara:strand:- start:186 stop:368 length:183 start_codon:yes stop_codon:yes gene_type:complete